MAVAYEKLKDFPKALKVLEEVLTLTKNKDISSSSRSELEFMQARLLASLNRTKEAIQLLQSCHRKYPKSADITTLLAQQLVFFSPS